MPPPPAKCLTRFANGSAFQTFQTSLFTMSRSHPLLSQLLEKINQVEANGEPSPSFPSLGSLSSHDASVLQWSRQAQQENHSQMQQRSRLAQSEEELSRRRNEEERSRARYDLVLDFGIHIAWWLLLSPLWLLLLHPSPTNPRAVLYARPPLLILLSCPASVSSLSCSALASCNCFFSFVYPPCHQLLSLSISPSLPCRTRPQPSPIPACTFFFSPSLSIADEYNTTQMPATRGEIGRSS